MSVFSSENMQTLFWFLLGGDLCEVSASLCGSIPAAGGAELPRYCYSQGHGTGGEVHADLFPLLFNCCLI